MRVNACRVALPQGLKRNRVEQMKTMVSSQHDQEDVCAFVIEVVEFWELSVYMTKH